VLESAEIFWKLVSRLIFSMMKQSNIFFSANTEIKWEGKHHTIVSQKPQPQVSHW